MDTIETNPTEAVPPPAAGSANDGQEPGYCGRTAAVREWDDGRPWFMWGEIKLTALDRLKLLLGWRVFMRFDAPSGRCSGGCDLSHQITRTPHERVRWLGAEGDSASDRDRRSSQSAEVSH